jgi:prefoldin subunit 5
MISAKVPCSIHPEEATLPLRWLCQLPLCGLAAEERLQAIIPRQQVNTHCPTVPKSSGHFLLRRERRFNKMPVPHLNIRIVQRSKGSSAVAGAAYQAGEKLFSEYDQKSKDHRRKQPEVVYTEILLPANAPPEYADRATLWNSAEEVEKQWNAQLARRFVLALPREVPLEKCPQMLKEYCEEQFVSKGMCCDFAIHDPDPPGHNPHCHIMLTMRAIDENGKWMPKSRKVYDIDENGERIRLPSGRWKSHKEDTVDWNEQYHAEEWRHGWEIVQNRYLEMSGSPERVDMRSYERQGLDIVPTVHMGAAVCALERKGVETNIGNLNRDIQAANRMMNAVRRTIKNLRSWIAEILEATKAAFAETEADKKNTSPTLTALLSSYLNLRKAERSEWSRYGQQKGTVDDLKTVSQAMNYLQNHELFTLEDLDVALQGVNEKAKTISAAMKKAEKRMQVITGIQRAVADCKTHKAVHDKYLKIGWKTRQAAFAESHRDELDSFNKAFRYLKKHGVDLNVNLDALQTEYDDLKSSHAELAGQLAAVREELKPMKDIRYWVGKVLAPEQAVEKKPEPKHSVTERLKHDSEKEKQQPEPERKPTQHKKEDMEL